MTEPNMMHGHPEEIMPMIGSMVVSSIANVNDAAARAELCDRWSELQIKLALGLGAERIDGLTEEQHLVDTKRYTRGWCEEVRQAIQQQKFSDNAKNN